MKYKNWEIRFLWEKEWGLGFWLLRGWFGFQLLSVKMVVSEAVDEEIKPIWQDATNGKV